MIIVFDNPADVIIVPEQKVSLESITITALIDSPSGKTVQAYTAEAGPITLWSDAAYDAIGQWTDSDVEARIKELYS